MMESAISEVRYAWRRLYRDRAVTALAVLCLGLGIGLNVTIFGFADAVLLKPLPFQDPDQLVSIAETRAGHKGWVTSLDYLDWRAQNRAFSSITARTWGNFDLSGVSNPEEIPGARVSADYFKCFGIAPERGRTFLPDESTPGKDKVVILAHAFWVRHFAADPQIIGKPITLSGEQFTVVGILPEKLKDADAEIWAPLSFAPEELNRDFHFLLVYGRLKQAFSLTQARADLGTIAARLARQFPATNKNIGVSVDPLREQVAGPGLKRTAGLLYAIVGLVFLAACAGATMLLLARSTARRPSTALRALLGASKLRLLLASLIEGLMLACIGGLLGVVLSIVTTRFFLRLIPDTLLPKGVQVAADYRVLLYACALAVVAAVVMGIVPLLHDIVYTFQRPYHAVSSRHTASLSQQHTLRWLMTAQVAVTIVLLVGVGLMTATLSNLLGVDLGFRPDHLLTLHLPLSPTKFNNGARVAAMYTSVLNQLSQVPGVKSVAIVSTLPVSGVGIGMRFKVVGASGVQGQALRGHFQLVSPGYFDTLGIPILRGRSLTAIDNQDAPPVAVVNQYLATQYFGPENPIGRKLAMKSLVAGKYTLGPIVQWEIVGVSRDVKVQGVIGEPTPEIYVTYKQSPWPGTYVVARTVGSPALLARPVSEEIHRIDKDQPINEIQPMESVLSGILGEARFRTIFAATFGALALLLSLISVYSAMSYSLRQRTRELAIRAAVGARPDDLVKNVIISALRLLGWGLLLGITGSLAASRSLQSFLFGVPAISAPVYMTACAILLLPALLSCYAAARRAVSWISFNMLQNE
ncbi:MAG TPA: ABC transporter permease [Bryobacteraceae bacterium]|jgi:putative ABC transport system permease protein|nr:ABC transporter permease [Bryobacteraceae bacterium]